MKARYGSIAVLFEASSSHKSRTAIHRAETNGKRKRHTEQPMAPTTKNGFRLPHFSLHVLSDMAPISG